MDMDFTSDVDGLDHLFELQASCPSANGQSTSKMRARNEVCPPNNQPSSIDGSLDNVLGIFGSPSNREDELQQAADAASAKTKTGSICVYPTYPVHLCCGIAGVVSNVELVEPEIYETMEDCRPGT